MGLQRQFLRHGHDATNPLYGLDEDGVKKRGVLDRFNDTLPVGKTLHPRKGYRTRSEKMLKASQIVSEQKRGKFPPAIFAWQGIKKILQASGIAS